MRRFLLLLMVLQLIQTSTGQSPPTSSSTAQPWQIVYQAGQEALLPLFDAVYQELRIPVEFVTFPSERAQAEANLGRVDGEVGRIPSVLALYPNLIQTKENLLTIRLEAWVAPAKSTVLRNAEDLADLRVGIEIGSKISEHFVAKRGWNVTTVATHDALAKLLTAGRLAVVLISSASQDSSVRSMGTMAVAELTRSETYHVLNQVHADLARDFDAALQRMKADGRYRSLLGLP